MASSPQLAKSLLRVISACLRQCPCSILFLATGNCSLLVASIPSDRAPAHRAFQRREGLGHLQRARAHPKVFPTSGARDRGQEGMGRMAGEGVGDASPSWAGGWRGEAIKRHYASIVQKILNWRTKLDALRRCVGPSTFASGLVSGGGALLLVAQANQTRLCLRANRQRIRGVDGKTSAL